MSALTIWAFLFFQVHFALMPIALDEIWVSRTKLSTVELSKRVAVVDMSVEPNGAVPGVSIRDHRQILLNVELLGSRFVPVQPGDTQHFLLSPYQIPAGEIWPIEVLGERRTATRRYPVELGAQNCCWSNSAIVGHHREKITLQITSFQRRSFARILAIGTGKAPRVDIDIGSKLAFGRIAGYLIRGLSLGQSLGTSVPSVTKGHLGISGQPVRFDSGAERGKESEDQYNKGPYFNPIWLIAAVLGCCSTIADVFRMSETEAETAFRKIRWTETQGEATCPECGSLENYEYRRPTGLLRFRCKACGKNFSNTSGTLFASHKAPFRAYLAAIAVFLNEAKGKNALALSRDLGMSHKACWIMLHKMREAMAAEFKGRKIGGEGKVAEVDGAYFGGYVKPDNFAENRRKAANQSGKRQSVVIVRERNGNSVPAVFKSESAALTWIKSRIAQGTVVNADEAASWDALNNRYEMRRINHQEAYSDGEACTNWAESYFSRIRRAEIGHHHHVSGPYGARPRRLMRQAIERRLFSIRW